MSPLESSNPNTVGTENCHIAKAQGENLVIPFMNNKALKKK